MDIWKDFLKIKVITKHGINLYFKSKCGSLFANANTFVQKHACCFAKSLDLKWPSLQEESYGISDDIQSVPDRKLIRLKF
jgi:hypothetical protein